ncbi:NAC domain-containing protein 83-like isoform X1 [Miscanthus floridulus]|uniref:NAC domain-containing protein 83-like isoform X1 n=1 Tax=Miscanthus floridulus TaxID=154761 RepID=UPI0034575CAA
MERPAQAPTQLPPGFRFHPTDEELVMLYLRRQALARPLPAAVIPVVHDVARLDPWDLPGANEGEGYFFSLRRAPATGRGSRRRRAGSGYWKATGKEKPVFLQCGGGGGKRQLLVGVKTALAFHRSETPPSSSRTGWIMHEYRLAVPRGVAEQRKKNASQSRRLHSLPQILPIGRSTYHSQFTAGCVADPGEWVVCRVFLKNNRPNRDANSKTLGHRASAAPPQQQHREDVGGQGQQPLMFSAPQLSSSSCVTGVTNLSDEDDEVSGGGITRDAPAAPQREAY